MITFTAPDPQDQFEKVFPVIDFDELVLAPSVLLKPVTVEVPLQIIFEKLLFEYIIEAVLGDEPLVVVIVMFPLATDLLNEVPMELLLIDVVPPAGIEKEWTIKRKAPLELTFKLLKILPFIFVVRLVLWHKIPSIAPEAVAL